MSDKVLERIFGKEFVEKYRKARAKAEMVSEQRLKEIKQYAIEHMKDVDNFALKYENLDVLLVFAPSKDDLLKVKKTSAGNYRVAAVWYGCESLRGPFISVFCGIEDLAKKIVRCKGAATLIVGKLREETYEGDVTYSFRCHGVIPIDESDMSNEEDSDEFEAQEEVEYEEYRIE